MFALDTRGVGKSSQLRCTAENETREDGTAVSRNEYPACLAELRQQELSDFATTLSAIDLGILMQRARTAVTQPAVPIWVFALSYGTLLAQRTIALFPGRIDAAVLMGTVPQGETFFLDYVYNTAQEALASMARRCFNDSSCRGEINTGENVDAFLVTLRTKVQRIAECPSAQSVGLTTSDAAVALGQQADIGLLGEYFGSVLNAFANCPDTDDARRLFASFRSIRNIGRSSYRLPSSRVFSAIILASEMSDWSRLDDEPTLAQRFGIAPVHFTRYTLDEIRSAAVYARGYWDRAAPTIGTTRVQIWNGASDARTSVIRAQARAARTGAQFVLVPHAGHSWSDDCFYESMHAFFSQTPYDFNGCAARIGN